jgi:hypothetical protein
MSDQLLCGLVMPISAIDGCTSEHWTEVNSIITDAVESIEKYNFTVRIVSDADDIGVIQKRIVQNIYNSEIIICDVSCKNPSVMFELGMRLAFDKPTIIIKDDKTDYSFDTGIIEHIPYPRDLRFNKIIEFKEKLTRKVIATYEEHLKDPNHSTFLKNFGQFKVASIDETKVSPDNMILATLAEIQSELSVLRRNQRKRDNLDPKVVGDIVNIIKSQMENNYSNSLDKIYDNEELMKNLEDIIKPGNYFHSQREFRSYINDLLLSLYV